MDPLSQQTQQALQPQQNQQQPNDPNQIQVTGADQEDDGFDPDIAKNLDIHLNHLPQNLKQYLVENLDENSINILGIVNGQEVYEYFQNIYQTQIAPLKQGNSTPSQSMNPGSQPVQKAQSQQPMM